MGKGKLVKKRKRSNRDGDIGAGDAQEADGDEIDEGLLGDISKMVRELAPEAEALGEAWAVPEAEVAGSAAKRRKAKAVATAAKGDSTVHSHSEKGKDHEAPLSKAVKKSARKSAAADQDLPSGSSVVVAPDEKRNNPKTGTAVTPGSRSAAAAAQAQASTANAERRSDDLKDNKVFLGGLPWSVDEDTLHKDFGKFGEIKRLYFRRDENGKPIGEASVFYTTKEEVEKVLLLDGIEYKGREIKVKRRSPRKRSGTKTRWAHNRMQQPPPEN